MLPDRTMPLGASPSPFAIPVLSRSFGSWRLSLDRTPFDQDALAEHYDTTANRWHDIIDRHGFGAAYQSLIAAVLSEPPYRQDSGSLRVLDAGVGTGAMSSAFCAEVRKRIRLDAVDISAAMLQEAKDRLAHEDVDLSLKRASLANLPYADNSFDVVLAAHVIEHLPNPQLALDEIHRVLKPGGILICSVTKASLIGGYVQLIWRTHRVSQSSALKWLRRCGLGAVRAIPFDRQSSAGWFSIGYVGKKAERVKEGLTDKPSARSPGRRQRAARPHSRTHADASRCCRRAP